MVVLTGSVFLPRPQIGFRLDPPQKFTKLDRALYVPVKIVRIMKTVQGQKTEHTRIYRGKTTEAAGLAVKESL